MTAAPFLDVTRTEADGAVRTRQSFESSSRVAIQDAAIEALVDPDDWGMSVHISVKRAMDAATVGAGWRFEGWSDEVFVVMPAAVYAANRFQSRRVRYSPKLPPADVKANPPVIITDVPRLGLPGEPSRLQLLAGDCALPAVGLFDPRSRRGIWMVCRDWTVGIDIEESPQRDWATVRFCKPGLREGKVFRVVDMTSDSPDRGRSFRAGETVSIVIQMHIFECPDVSALYERYAHIRDAIVVQAPTRNNLLPFSAAFEIQHRKYNAQNWGEGYYAVGMRENAGQDFQTGWTGGMINTYPLAMCGEALSCSRVVESIDWFCREGLHPSGLARDSCHQGRWRDGKYDAALVRRTGDAIHWLVRLFVAGEGRGLLVVREHWRQMIARLADALQQVWRDNGQLGQWVCPNTLHVVVGGSSCAGIAGSALARAGRWLGRDDLLQTACEIGEHFRTTELARGYSTGGPGDALQCPDSESAAALLETFVTLHETTGDQRWIKPARSAANLLATWVTADDYPFPPNSTFGRLAMQSRGTVFANVQNKHSAPGLCTDAGVALLRLYRLTGEGVYLRLLGDIAHALPQFLSRDVRPIQAKDGRPMPAGWMNERVNTSDWNEPVGEIFFGSCWCEISLMLTWSDLPGVYACRDERSVVCLDHVEARWEGDKLAFRNSTPFDAHVRVMVESAADRQKLLADGFAVDLPLVHIPPGQSLRSSDLK